MALNKVEQAVEELKRSKQYGVSGGKDAQWKWNSSFDILLDLAQLVLSCRSVLGEKKQEHFEDTNGAFTEQFNRGYNSAKDEDAVIVAQRLASLKDLLFTLLTPYMRDSEREAIEESIQALFVGGKK